MVAGKSWTHHLISLKHVSQARVFYPAVALHYSVYLNDRTNGGQYGRPSFLPSDPTVVSLTGSLLTFGRARFALQQQKTKERDKTQNSGKRTAHQHVSKNATPPRTTTNQLKRAARLAVLVLP